MIQLEVNLSEVMIEINKTNLKNGLKISAILEYDEANCVPRETNDQKRLIKAPYNLLLTINNH